MSGDEPVVGRRRRVPLAVKIVIGLVLAVAVLYLLFFHVFPWVEQLFEDPTISG